MANYNLKCKDCNEEEIVSLPVSEFLNLKDSRSFYLKKCKKCNAETQFVRNFKPASSKISKDRQELMSLAKEEARKIVEKVNMGDTKTILDVYGEKA